MTKRLQQGTYLIMMSVLMAVLAGFGALSIDLNRLYVLRSEMQNAADAAAIAAAMELNGDFGAQSRATAAARNLLQHNGRFAEVAELLGGNIGLEFYCAIGAKYDPEPADIDIWCSNPYDADGKSVATNDAETHYVRVNLTPTDGSDAYSMQLIFLPVLEALLADADDRVFLNATAVGGRSFYMCNYPPMMLCNPFEGTTLDFDEEMDSGDQIVLKQQGSNTWAPGNFSFLEPDNESGGGAPEVSAFLADEGNMGCKAPIVTTKTGAMTNQTMAGINTRFDIYQLGRKPSDYPPAPNVIDFPRDQTWSAVDSRFGNGDWNRDSYFSTYHDWQGHTRPGSWFEMTRWDVYNWEISTGLLPSKAPLANTSDSTYDGIPTPANIYNGSYPPPPSVPERRAFHIAIINCVAHGLSGTQTLPIIEPEGFARIFLTEHVDNPPASDIYAEYIEWAGDSSDGFHVDVQLHE